MTVFEIRIDLTLPQKRGVVITMDSKDYLKEAKMKMESDPYIGEKTPLKSYSPPRKREETESQRSLQKLIAQQIWSARSNSPYDYLFQLD